MDSGSKKKNVYAILNPSRWNHEIVKNGSLSELFLRKFPSFPIFFFSLLPDRPANKTRAKIDELVFFGVTEYFIRKDRADRSIGTRQWIDDGDSSPPRQENKQRLRSRGIKGIYRDEFSEKLFEKVHSYGSFRHLYCFSYLSIDTTSPND